MATVVFRPLVSGNSSLSFKYTAGATDDSNAISLATIQDILQQPQSLTFSVAGNISIRISVRRPIGSNHAFTGLRLLAPNTSWTQTVNTTNTGDSIEIQLPDTFIIGNSRQFSVDATGYLRKTISKTLADGLNVLSFGTLSAGDLNDDGIVNNIDLSQMYEDWYVGQIADYNTNGLVDTQDHGLLINNFLKENEVL